MELQQQINNIEIHKIPEDWNKYSLNDLADTSRNSIKRGPWGGSITKNMFVNSGFKVYEQKNVIYENFSLGNYYINEEKFNELKGFEIKPNDILISCSGTFGKIAIVPKDVERGIINQALLKISLNESKIDTKYFKYFFESDDVQKEFFGLTHGSAIKNIVSISTLKKMIFPIPPLKEQQKIASILSNLDNLIQKTNQIIEQTQRLKKGLMQRLLTKGIGHTKFKKTELGEIPEDWSFDEIQNHSKITTGAKNTQDRIEGGKYPFFVRSQKIERINTYSFDGEAVLTAGDGVGTGKVFHYINGKFDFHQRVYKISKFSDHLYGYFFYLYFSNYFLRRVTSMSAKASVDSVRMDMIAKMLIPIPAIKEQQKIATILLNVENLIQTLKNKKQSEEILKKGLMQQLLTGKIRVTA